MFVTGTMSQSKRYMQLDSTASTKSELLAVVLQVSI